ncbi:MAG: helix-turn-helix domain-containing protein [Acidimicrobiia bacterium]|nr:helix-turn-helix domain-containing protein [Acidimicrobiia bacterium]
MRRTRFDEEACPIARVTDLLGDWWTPLVLRELLYGRSRFDQIQDRLGISRPILSQRLRRLESEGMVVRERYQDSPPRHEYRLTAKGEASWEVVAALWRYGSDWFFTPEGAPGELYDSTTGRAILPQVVDANTGKPIARATARIRSRTRG